MNKGLIKIIFIFLIGIFFFLTNIEQNYVNAQSDSDCPSVSTNLGVIETTVNITQTATYKVWTRVMADSDFANSYYLQIDNQCPTVVGDVNGMTFQEWIWVDYKDGDFNNKITVDLTSGTHNVKLIGRESGLKVDKLIFTTDFSCTPSETGENCEITAITPTPTPVFESSLTLYPVADTYVTSDSAGSNFGNSTTLEVDAGGGIPSEIAYLKFDLSSLVGKSIVSAKLRIYVTNGSLDVFSIKEVTNTLWQEDNVTYSNRPALSTTLTTFSNAASSSWQEIDLTNFIASMTGQMIALGMDTTGSDGLDFRSKESNNPPQLVVSLAKPNITSTPTLTSTPTITLTPTPTIVLIPTKTPTPIFTPTPTQIEVSCNLSSASWDRSTAEEGTTVSLTVTASGNCSSKQVRFVVREHRTALPDIDAQNQPIPNIMTFTQNGSIFTATVIWVADTWHNACIIGVCDPTYFFKASIVGSDTEIESSNQRTITITQSQGQSADPTPIPTLTLIPTSTTAPSQSPGQSSGKSSSSGSSGSDSSSSNSGSAFDNADLNNDGKVNIFDLSIFLRNWNKSGQGDLNKDGKVNIFDLSILLRNWRS